MTAIEFEVRNTDGTTRKVYKGAAAQRIYRKYGKVAPFQCEQTDNGLRFIGAFDASSFAYIYFA